MTRRYLMDTGQVGLLNNGKGEVRRRFRQVRNQGHRVGVIPPVLGELWHGAYNSDDPPRRVQRLTVTLRELVVWLYDDVAAVKYGQLSAELQQRGITIQQVDRQVAAVAFVLGCTVVASNGDFKHIPGLDLEDWST